MLFTVNNLLSSRAICKTLIEHQFVAAVCKQVECSRPKASFNAYSILEKKSQKQIELINELYWFFNYATSQKDTLEELLSQYPNLIVHLCEDFLSADQDSDPSLMHPLLTSIANLIEAAQSLTPCLQKTLAYLVQNVQLHAKLIATVVDADGSNKKLCLFMLSNLLVFIVGSVHFDPYLAMLTADECLDAIAALLKTPSTDHPTRKEALLLVYYIGEACCERAEFAKTARFVCYFMDTLSN